MTSEDAQYYTHQQRKNADAILTTAETILQDNPHSIFVYHMRISKALYILDRRSRLTKQERIFKINPEITIFDKPTDLDQALKTIAEAGKHELWIEAGGHLLQSLLEEQRLQELLVYIAPTLQLSGRKAF